MIDIRRGAYVALCLSVVIALVAILVGPAIAEDPDPSAEVIVLKRCVIDYETSTAVGSSLHGMLQDCLVAPGDRVEAGQLLGCLRDDDARAELRLRELEAASDVTIRLSAAREAAAKNKMARTATLLRRNAASQEEYNLHRLEAEAASMEVEQARHKHALAQVQLRQAEASVRARALICPHEGVVIGLFKRRGEPVAPNEVIFRVVDPRSLDVAGQVDVVDLWRLKVGQPVKVVPELAGADLAVEREVFHGRVAFVDTHVDPLTRTCKVVARVANRGNLLRAGLEARMEIDPSAPSGATLGLSMPLSALPPAAPSASGAGVGRR
jgi:RND family efflux transporter MFP subunit